MDAYHRIIRTVVPELEYHQNRYGRVLESVVRRGCRWLDLGAGTRVHGGWLGATEEVLRARASLLVGCDLEGEHLRRNRLLSAAACADARRLPFAEDSFDLVSANMVLEHLDDPVAVFAEVQRVLAPGGRFVFVTPNRGHPVVAAMALLVAPGWRRTIARFADRRDLEHIFLTHYKANSPEAVHASARAASLEVEMLEPFSSYPMFRFAPLTFLECLWIRAVRTRPLRGLSSNLVGILAKPAPLGAPQAPATLRVSAEAIPQPS